MADTGPLNKAKVRAWMLTHPSETAEIMQEAEQHHQAWGGILSRFRGGYEGTKPGAGQQAMPTETPKRQRTPRGAKAQAESGTQAAGQGTQAAAQ
jgi:hypothetical protein